MTLSSMVVSRDWPEVSVLECILGALHIEVEVETDSSRACAKLAKSKIDALIVDSDLDGSLTILQELPGGITQQPVPMLIFSGSLRKERPHKSLATFFFQKPISVEQAVRTLSAARSLIVDGRLRYHRQPLNAPVSFRFGAKKRLDAQLMNLSQGGLRVAVAKPLPADGILQVSFSLPGTANQLSLPAQVAWQNHQGHAGIQFLSQSEAPNRELQLWLEQRFLSH
jgi:hypothetical protein